MFKRTSDGIVEGGSIISLAVSFGAKVLHISEDLVMTAINEERAGAFLCALEVR